MGGEKACSHFSMGIIKPFFLCHFVFALQYPNMRYHVSPGVCPPQIVIAAPWAKLRPQGTSFSGTCAKGTARKRNK